MFRPLAAIVSLLHKVSASSNVNYGSTELLPNINISLRILYKYTTDFLSLTNCCQ